MRRMIRESHDIPKVKSGDRYMTTSMVAHASRVTPQAVNKAIKEGRLDATVFVGKYYILMSDAKKYAEAAGRKFSED